MESTNEPRLDHSQYMAGWLTALQNETRFIFKASADAQLASDWILSRKHMQDAAE